jgi:catechol 2,3-dioxygenase-like lactoylglutathione lyase family enzyme
MKQPEYGFDHWPGGMSYASEKRGTYLCFLPAPEEHSSAGYYRKRIGINHIAFYGKSRAHVDEIAAWVKQAGHTALYED